MNYCPLLQRCLGSLVLLSFLVAPVAAQIKLEKIADKGTPVFITESPDKSGRLFIADKSGFIHILKDGQIQGEYLDIEDLVSRGAEQGLLGIAFPPDFAKTKVYYVNFTDRQGDTVIARFTENSSETTDEKSLKVIMKIVQPFPNHNGGQIEFGPDGYLYIGMGDGGNGGDPNGNGQNLKTLLGKMLRIDVSKGDSYQIPPDNPFTNNKAAKPEIWALGLRNPWRFSFDKEGGKLFAADVGQDLFEEIDIIEKGKNYGWNTVEGNQCFKGPCDQSKFTAPIHTYARSDGVCIIGGYVYRGSAIPKLKGTYVFGDYGMKKVWGLKEENGSWTRTELLTAEGNITSFGQDAAGELYLTTEQGGVYRLAAAEHPVP